MAGKISKVINLVSNMGLRYTAFRMRYEVLRRTGLYKRKFPAAPAFRQYATLGEWKNGKGDFFFKDRESLSIPRDPQEQIRITFKNIKDGKLLLFNSLLTDLGTDYDWVTNPDSGFHYDVRKHWTEIADYSKEAGDIKFVWEKSRFSYLYDIIRYDYHFSEDCAALVFHDILTWIKSNPVNCGPNYRCSQEMSLRVLNWTFALYYYRNSPLLTDEVFDQVQYALYWHMHHVYNNIDFSRIAVRNNHAITETLTLYVAGLLFPSLPGAANWKAKGKAWFEEEIAYQVYEDGTFLQYSMNYHRLVVQLLTWGIALTEKNGERFSPVVYDRAEKSVKFLCTCIVNENGWLPNYGANDGALFFKLSDTHYRDYRPQLQALAKVLGMDTMATEWEDKSWYGIDKQKAQVLQVPDGIYSFPKGGYYIVREPDTLTFIKCGSYKDRPSHADNLHLDIWYKGENLLLDAGSYKYNTDEATIRYFSGTASHNTVMLDDKDQMLKGGRFIWYYWSQSLEAMLKEKDGAYIFEGTVNAFRYIKEGVVHKRTVIKQMGVPVWEIKDEVSGAPVTTTMSTLWHMPLNAENKVAITAKNRSGEQVQPIKREGWYSSLYGQKVRTGELYFSDAEKHMGTVIKIND